MINQHEGGTNKMKQRFIALLLAVCIACTMLVVPASASSANTAVQAAVMLGGLTSEQAAGQDAALTRGQLAKLLAAFSPYRESANAQGTAGTLFTDVAGSDPLAPAIRIAVSQGWMSGYTDGSFRPSNPVTLEEACAAALNLLGYDVTTLSGTFPTAQLNKARELGLRDGVNRSQGETLTVADGAVLLYNALTAPTAEGEVYGSSLGFTITGGQVDASSILLGNVQGPFVAQAGAQLPFAPAASVTVAGTEYTVGSSQAASVLSSLNGGGVGQVVTLLLGMNNEVVQVLTGSEADQVFYGVVQNSARSLIEDDGADVRQSVTVACTDGVTRTVNVDKSLNFPAGLLVEITVTGEGEQVARVDARSVSGTFNENGTALSGTPLADGVEIIDTTAEGVAGAVRPSRLSGVTLQSGDVRYYTTNAAGEIDRMILDNVTGDLWTYGILDDVRNLTSAAADAIDDEIGRPSGEVSLPSGTTGTGNAAADVADIILPSTSDILYGIIDGSIASTLWDNLTSSTGSVASYVLRLAADNTTGAMSNILGWLGKGASYVCYINGENTTLNTSVKYPVLAGGVAVSRSPSGTVKNMIQLMPAMIDKVGAASVMSGSTRYETADDMQVYLWYRGQYYPTTLAQVNPEEYYLIGWYDNLGCTAGNKIRVLVAVKKD